MSPTQHKALEGNLKGREEEGKGYQVFCSPAMQAWEALWPSSGFPETAMCEAPAVDRAEDGQPVSLALWTWLLSPLWGRQHPETELLGHQDLTVAWEAHGSQDLGRQSLCP